MINLHFSLLTSYTVSDKYIQMLMCVNRFLNVTVDYRHGEGEWQQLQCKMDEFAS